MCSNNDLILLSAGALKVSIHFASCYLLLLVALIECYVPWLLVCFLSMEAEDAKVIYSL